jgi:hypothetical protein
VWIFLLLKKDILNKKKRWPGELKTGGVFSWPLIGVFSFSMINNNPYYSILVNSIIINYHWTNCDQTLVEWSLDGPLSKVCPVIPTSNQDGRQAKNRKKGGWNFNCPLLL